MSLTVLLAEDEAAVRAFVRKVLVRQGYAVLEASNGREALEVSRGHDGPIDLLLSDVVMPELSGPAAAATLMRERPGLRVLFMSGYAAGEMGRDGELDADIALLEKPFTPQRLADKISEVVAASPPGHP